MEKSEVRILVVEDDPSLGKGLLELFKRSGYETILCTTPEQALAKAEQQEFHAFIIDCMLPKMNGVDLAQKILKQQEHKAILILITGVFKDKSFIKDALAKTGALTLLSKPFQLEKLLSLVDRELKKSIVDPEIEPFHALLTFPDCSSAQILNAVQEQRAFHAYHLPLLLSLFARQGMSGDLNIVSSDREVSQITLIEGRIVDVRSQSPSTQLGELLIEFGFAMPEDVAEALQDGSGKSPLGKRMVEAGTLSPHAVGLIREEQLAIRLSQLIQNSSLDVSWTNRNVEMTETFHALAPNRLKNLMSEWILSKISAEWLRTFYLQYADRSIGWRGKVALKIDGAKANMPMLPLVLERMPKQPSVQDLLVEAGEDDLGCLQAIHTLVLERKIYFGEKRRNAGDFAGKILRYQRLLATLKEKDLFQILGVSHAAQKAEIQRALTELAKQFHPDKMPIDSPEELKNLGHQIFTAITNAYDILSDETKRKNYVHEQSQKEASRIVALEPVFDDAINDLRTKKFSRALKKFENLIALKAPVPNLRAYYFWAKIKAGVTVNERDFLEIPPEHRHSGVFLLVKGLHYRSLGKYQKAMECYQHARLIDRNLKDAHAELVDLAEFVESRDKGLHTMIFRFIGAKSKRSA